MDAVLLECPLFQPVAGKRTGSYRPSPVISVRDALVSLTMRKLELSKMRREGCLGALQSGDRLARRSFSHTT